MRHHSWPCMQGRDAFTVVELLTTLVIIAVLLAITVPAVQQVRETGRKVDCLNRLAELAKATASFEAQYRHLPPSPPGGRTFSIESGSPHVFLLPFLEQSSVYDRIRHDGSIFSFAPDPQVLMTQANYLDIELFRCPSDQSEWGTNYRICAGPHVLNYAAEFYGYPVGIGKPLPGRLLAEITDGTSHTALASESLLGSASRGVFSPQADSWMGGLDTLPRSELTNDRIISLCSLAASNPAPYFPYSGWFWTTPGIESTLYNHVVAPNSRIINCNSVERSFGKLKIESHVGIQKASSRHPGGVNVALVDGSVHFTSNTIDLGVWQAIGSIASGD